MVLRRLTGLGIALATLLTALTMQAQEVATLALRNGERPSGELLDLNASGFWLRINGQDRAFPSADVSAVEFVVGPVPAEAQARINEGRPFVLLRNGQVVDGRLSDLGGTRPLRITIDTPGGAREFLSTDVAQIHINPVARPAQQPAPPQAQPGGAPPTAPEGAIAVPANVAWTDTRIAVAPGQRVRFSATGDIMISSTASTGPGGRPAARAQSARYPLPGAPAGALIGRIDNEAPFLIGASTQPIAIRNFGFLRLGVNDDQVADNSGSFLVTVARAN